MIAYLKGKVIGFEENAVILENNGVGFYVNCSATAFNKLAAEGGGEVFVYTAVKEDDISLYGFSNLDEKKAFTELISVSGVGPKMGITVLSQMDLPTLSRAVTTGDVKLLSSVKGLGKKTAERIIVDLKDKFSCVSGGNTVPVKRATEPDNNAVLALISLGFSKSESEKAVVAAMEEGETSLQKIIAAALKQLG